MISKKTNNATIPVPTTTKFIPSAEEWNILLEKYKPQIVRSRRRFGSWQDCEDALMCAMGKILGLDPNHQLKKPLVPMTVVQWVYFIQGQARSFLSHNHTKEAKWTWAGNTHKELNDAYKATLANHTLNENARAERLLNIQRQAMCLVEMECIHNLDTWSPTKHIDVKVLYLAVRIMVDLVCRKCGVSERDHKAFVRFVLDGDEARNIADELLKGKCGTLYTLVSRLNEKLRKHGRALFGRSIALAEEKLWRQGA